MNDATADYMGLKPELMPQDTNDQLVRVSRLDVPSHMMYNKSKITCMGVSFVPHLYPNKLSEDGLLLVQGVPGQVLYFDGTNVTSTRLRFSWSPPHHIPGIPPCCHGYSVNITNAMSYEVIFEGNITNTTIYIDVEPEHLCSVYEITIIAINKLGEGEPLTTKWSLGGYFEASKASLLLSYDEEEELNVNFNVTIDGYCLNDLDNITLSVQCDKKPDNILRRTNKISAKGQERRLHTDISVLIPETHHNTECSSEIALENNVDLHGIRFATHDIIGTNIIVLPGVVCVSCDYLPGSPARGCVLVVSPVGINSDVENSVNVPMGGRDCLSNIKKGRYTVRVYDWESDGGRSGQYVHHSEEDIIEKVTPNTNGSSTEGVSSNSHTAIIVGVSVSVAIILVGVVLAVVIGFIVYKQLKNKKGYSCTDGEDEPDGPGLGILLLPPKTARKKINSLNDLNEIIDMDYCRWTYCNMVIGGETCVVMVKEQ